MSRTQAEWDARMENAAPLRKASTWEVHSKPEGLEGVFLTEREAREYVITLSEAFGEPISSFTVKESK